MVLVKFPRCAGSSHTLLLLDYALSTVNSKYWLTSYTTIRSLYRHVVCNVTPVSVYVDTNGCDSTLTVAVATVSVYAFTITVAIAIQAHTVDNKAAHVSIICAYM